MVLRFTVDIPGERLDKFLAVERGDLSRAHIASLVARGLVTVNCVKPKTSYRLKVGDVVEMKVEPPEPMCLLPQDIPIAVIYEDADLLVVNKPAGMVVHPAPGHPTGTLVNALLARFWPTALYGQELRPGIVHRLDKDTSGLMIVAKNRHTHEHISKQIKDRKVRKGYLALLTGVVEPSQGVIRSYIGRDPRNRKRMTVAEVGRDAETSYRLLEVLPEFSLVEVFPKTGRTHQIRVHFSSLGFPLAGDSLYGGKDPRIGRQFLHANFIGFTSPSTDKYMEFNCSLPEELETFLNDLRGHGSGLNHEDGLSRLAGRI